MSLRTSRVLGAVLIASSLAVFFIATRAGAPGATPLRLALFSAAFCLWIPGLLVLTRMRAPKRWHTRTSALAIVLLGATPAPLLAALVVLFLPSGSVVWVFLLVLVAGAMGAVGGALLARALTGASPTRTPRSPRR